MMALITLSLSKITGPIDWSTPPPVPSLILHLPFVLFAIIGFIVLLTIALKPRLFWQILTMVTVGTGGLVIQNFGFTDEYLVGCIFLGIFLAMSIGAIRFKNNRVDSWEQLHKWIFLIMAVYMFTQSVRGMLIWEELRKIRWPVYFGTLGVLSFLISHPTFSVPSPRKLSFTVVITSLVYFTLYVAIGMFYEIVLGVPRCKIQNVSWGGSTYAAFLLVIVMPAIFLLINDKNRVYRKMSWAALIIITFQSFYYDSRVSWLCILSFFIISLRRTGFRRSIYYLLIFIIFLGIYFQLIAPEWYTLKNVSKVMVDSIIYRLFVLQEGGYLGRGAHIRIAFPIISKNWHTFLFGYGFRASVSLIGPELARVYTKYRSYGIAQRMAGAKGSTVGFTNLLTDTGVIGMLLLIMNFFLVARKIFVLNKTQSRNFFLLSLLLTYLWLIITNPLDIILFYLIIMPSGLLIQLSKYREVEQSPKRYNLT